MVLVPTHIEINKIDESHIATVKILTEETDIIPYKDWKRIQKTSQIYKLPIEYCKFRVDNGRIATEITTYETSKGILDPNAETTQQTISNFLSKSDTANNEILIKSLRRDGQKDPAVITADGFLINGNRRKWALEELNKAHPNEKYKYLKVIILPGSNSPERPTTSDLVLMENDFQLYSDGRSEYSSMNKTLTLYKNVQKGIGLEEMLRQDPGYSNLDDKDFKKNIQKFKTKYFRPLELMSEYLQANKRKNDFVSVEDKWTAFQDMSERVMDQIEDEKGLAKHQVDEKEVGIIKAAGFNIIKLRDHGEVDPRTHKLMARMLKWVEVDKKEVLKIGKIDDPYEHISDPDERFNKWNNEFNEKIVNSIKKLDNLVERKKDQEGPIKKLEDILQKLNADEFNLNQLKFMKKPDIPEALKIANSIQTSIKELVNFFYYLDKDEKFQIETLIEAFNKKK